MDLDDCFPRWPLLALHAALARAIDYRLDKLAFVFRKPSLHQTQAAQRSRRQRVANLDQRQCSLLSDGRNGIEHSKRCGIADKRILAAEHHVHCSRSKKGVADVYRRRYRLT